jgi:membrane protein required for colicin V production
MTELGWVDWAFIALLAVSVGVGLWRGLVLEVLSLLGWVAAYVGAQWFAPEIAPQLPVGRAGSALNHAAGFVVVFVVVLVVWALLARLLRFVIHATPLGAVDRVLGATFGLARALVVMLAITTVVLLTSLAQSQAWRDSHGAAWLGGALREIKPVLPARIAQHLPR